MKTSNANYGLYVVESLTKGAHENTKTSQAINKTIEYSLHIDGKALLLKETLIYLTDYKVGLGITRPFSQIEKYLWY